MGKSTLLSTLYATQGAMDVHIENILKAKDPQTRAIDPKINSSYIGNTLSNSLGLVRRDDPSVTKMQTAQLTKSSNFETISSFFNDIQSEIGGEADPQKSSLVTAVTDFLSQGIILPGNGDISMKQAFIDKGQALAVNINKVTDKITDLRYSADKDIGASIDVVNHAIRNLFEINKEIVGGRTGNEALKLYDTRDKLVNTIAEALEIKVSYGSKGEALVSSAKNSLPVVSAAAYSKLTYDGFSSKEALLAGEAPNPVNLILMGNGQGTNNSFEVLSDGGSNGDSSVGGKIGALISLRDSKLKDTYDAVQQLVKVVVEKVNKIHNDGSTWPPKTKFQSDIKVSGSDVLDWGSKVSIYPVNAEGEQLQGGGGPLNAITLDFDKLLNSFGTVGSPSVWDVLKELNSQLDVAPSRPRISMGAILADDPMSDSGIAQVRGQYLLNNVELAGASKIDNTGNFTFDLDLMGNQYFGSDVEILEVTTSGGYVVPTANLPQPFRLEKDTNSRTGGAIAVNGIVAGAPQTISVKMRVIGDNGVVSQGTAVFQVDPANPDLLNKRVAAEPIAAVPGVANDFINQAISHSGVATAKLIDENGIEIKEGSEVAGKIVIETNSPDYRLVIQDGNFSNVLKFNDLIKHDENGLISIRQDITEDVNLLSTGRVTRSEKRQVGASVGDTAATASLTFSVAVMAPGDTVTIHDQTFNFVIGAPANQNEIQITGVLNTDVAALLTAIQNHSELKSIVTAGSASGNNTINLIAKTVGSSSNTLAVKANIAGGGNVVLRSGGTLPTPPAAAVNGFFGGGMDKPVEVQRIYTYTIGNKSTEVLEAFNNLANKILDIPGEGLVPDSNTTLVNYVSQITSVLANQANDAESDSDVAKGVLTTMQERISDKFGNKREEQFDKFLEMAQYLREVASVIKESNSIIKEVFNIMFN